MSTKITRKIAALLCMALLGNGASVLATEPTVAPTPEFVVSQVPVEATPEAAMLTDAEALPTAAQAEADPAPSSDVPAEEPTANPDEQARQAAEVAAQWVAAMDPSAESEYEQALWLYGCLIANVQPGSGSTAFAALAEGSADSLGYALAYEALLNEAGIEVKLVQNEEQAWNIACLDGEWTHIDAYQDDLDGSHGMHFGLTDAAMASLRDWDGANLPACTAGETNYFVRTAGYASFAGEEALAGRIVEALRNGEEQLLLYNAGESLDVQAFADGLLAADPVRAAVSQNGYIVHIALQTGAFGAVDPAPLPGEAPAEKIAAETIVPAAESLNLAVGQQVSVADWILLPEGAQASVRYSSKSTRIATVSEDGLVTAHMAGTTTIALETDGGLYSEIALRVEELPAETEESAATEAPAESVLPTEAAPTVAITPEPSTEAALPAETLPGISVGALPPANLLLGAPATTDLKLYVEDMNICRGDTRSLEYALTDDESGAVSFEISDESIAVVDKEGRITARKPGRTLLVASTESGDTGVCVITVVPAPEALTLTTAATTIGVDERVALFCEADTDGVECSVSYSSSNSKTASVSSNGVVTAKKTGTVTITATAFNGVKDKIKLTIKKAPTKITMTGERKSLGVGETMQLGYKLPSDTAGSASFTSEDPKIATVTGDGLITGIKKGTAAITVTAYNGKKQTVDISVRPAPKELILSKTEISLLSGEEYTLKYKFDEGAMGSVTFSSADESIATVDAEGCITAVSQGPVEIHATTHNGVEASCLLTVVPQPTGLELLAPRTSMGLKEEMALECVVYPEGTETSIKYRTSNADIATIDKNGVVTAKKTGSVTFSATTANGVKAKIKITVKKAPTKVTMTGDRKWIGVGESLQLDYKLPSGTAGGATFESKSPKIAQVTEDGLITGIKPGTASVTVTTYNGKKDSVELQVCSAPTEILLPERMTLCLGDSVPMKYGFKEGEAGSVTLQSQDEDIVSVNEEGLLTAKAEGFTLVTATAHNGVSATCLVEVGPEPEEIYLTADRTTIGLKEKLQLNCTFSPEDGACSLKYTSSKASVASVNEDGVVTAKKTGSATITATAFNGVKAKIKITVKKAPTKITLECDRKVLGVGESLPLDYSLSSGSAGGVTFYSDNPEVLGVNAYGELTALSTGEAIITAETYNGKERSMAFTVKAAPTAIDLSQTVSELGVGQTATLVGAVNEGAAGAVHFRSENPSIASVNEDTGKVTALKRGTAILTAYTYVEGVQAQFALSVKNAPDYITVPYETLTIGVGDEIKLEPMTNPGAAASFEFSSSSAKYAKVDDDGVVTGRLVGKTTITIKAHNGVKCKLPVVVKKAPSSLKFEDEELFLGQGESAMLVPVFSSNSAATVSYESMDENVVTVNENGLVCAVRPGTTIVKGQTHNGKKASCAVTVSDAPLDIVLELPDTMGVDQVTTAKVQLLPEGSVSSIKYSVISGSAVSVDRKGNVHALRTGKAVVRAESYVDGVYDDHTITVKAAPTYIGFEEDNYSVTVGDLLQLSPILSKNSATQLTYEVEKAGFFTVDANGVVTPIMRGSTRVKATTHNGLYAIATIQVVDPYYPESIELKETPPDYLEPDFTYTPSIEVYPSSAKPAIVWSSSDTKIASVDPESGEVYAHTSGRAEITGVSSRNPALSISYNVVVLAPDRCLKMPMRRSEIKQISTVTKQIKEVRESAYAELESLRARGVISNSEYNTRHGYVERAFDMYLTPWMTETFEPYWKAANDEGGLKNFKPDIVYHGIPYTQTNRVNSKQSMLKKGYLLDVGKSYYLLNGDKFENRMYPGSDCSSFVSMAVWGFNHSRASDNTRSIEKASYYRTLTDWTDLRTGDLLCRGGHHVVMFLYYANEEKTQMVIIEQGGGEIDTNTISCSIRTVEYYTKRDYEIRRVSSLAK